MRGKSGMSAVVVSVLIILITVAAITVTWYLVLPLINDMETSGDVNANLMVSLKGYTSYDVSNEMAFVQIRRGVDDVEVDALDVIFIVDGTSFIFRTENSPDNNEMATYNFDFEKEGIVGLPSTVKVVPVFFRGFGEEIGTAMDAVSIPIEDVILSDWLAAKEKAKDNVLKKTPVAEEVTVLVDVCKDDFEDGEVYTLNKNYRLSSGSTCFYIDVDNVVLDLNGYLIIGNDSGYGVNITGKNVVVKNGRIERFEKGVFIDGTGGNDANRIIDNSFVDNVHSVYVDFSFENFIEGNNMANGSFSNIYLDNADRNNVANNWACGSPKDIFCVDSTSGNFGLGNTFGNVVDCPTAWLGNPSTDYVECED